MSKRGFSTTNLRYFRSFFLAYANRRRAIRHIGSGESSPAATASTPRNLGRRIRHTTGGVLAVMSRVSSGKTQPRGFSPKLGCLRLAKSGEIVSAVRRQLEQRFGRG
ncbi:MAG: hypothetical protein WCG85_27300, partial [Polyangia bacterium]